MSKLQKPMQLCKSVAFFFVHCELNEVERVQSFDQSIAEFINNVFSLQLGEEREHIHLGSRLCHPPPTR